MSIDRIFEVVEGGVFSDAKGKRIYSAYDLKLLKTPQVIFVPVETEDIEKYLETQFTEGKIKFPKTSNAYLVSDKLEEMQFELEGKQYCAYTISFFIRGIIDKKEEKK